MYYLRDFDDKTQEEISVEGEHYIQLLDVCFQYCTHFSLLLRYFSVEHVPLMPVPLRSGLSINGCCCFYECSQENRNYLLTKNDLFEWLDTESNPSPEDLTFYRSDGTVFFWSEIHEGICALFDRKDEDVAQLVSKRGWIYYDPVKEGNHIMIPKTLYST